MKVNHFAELKIGYFKKIGFLFDMYAWMQLWQTKDMNSLLIDMGGIIVFQFYPN